MSLVLTTLLYFTDTHEEDMHLLPLYLTGLHSPSLPQWYNVAYEISCNLWS